MIIMVIEDNEVTQQDFRAVLAGAGHKVAAVGSAEEAIDLIDGGFTPDALVVDLFFPKKMSGGELIVHLKDRLPEVVPGKVVVTSVAARRMEQELVELGVPPHQILQKGRFGPDDLVRCIQGIKKEQESITRPATPTTYTKESATHSAAPPPRSTELQLKTACIYLQEKAPSEQHIRDMGLEVLEGYKDFVLVRATDDVIQKLRDEGFSVDVRDDLNTIHLAGYKIDTTHPRFDKDGKGLPHSNYKDTKMVRGLAHYIVQFIGPPKKEWSDQLEATGAKVLSEVPQYAYLVEMNSTVLKEVLKLRFVRWVGEYAPEFRIARALTMGLPRSKSRNNSSPSDETAQPFLHPIKPQWTTPMLPGLYVITFFSQENLNAACKKVEEIGGTILREMKGSEYVGPSLAIDLTRVPAEKLMDKRMKLAALHGVHHMGSYPMPTLYNNVACRLIAPGISIGLPPFDGEGEVIAIADTGLDKGDPADMHPGLLGRVLDVHPWQPNATLNALVYGYVQLNPHRDRYDGHGTHVAGSIVGTAQSPDGQYRGVAPSASLFVQALEHHCDWQEWYRDRYFEKLGKLPPPFRLAGLPDDLAELFEQAWEAGARIHTNSWGNTGGFSDLYDGSCIQVDAYIRKHPEFVILFAAGNDGEQGLGTVTSPGTAKNCITVGASHTERPEKGCTGSHNVASFSARGPTIDQRIKPDLVAPGVHILSTRSRCRSPYQPVEITDNYLYCYESGTSMATPLVAGAAALVRQFVKRELRKRNLESREPSAALVKALLLNGAERRDFAGEPCSLLYDMVQGWGHLNLTNILSPPEERCLAWSDVGPRQEYPVSQPAVLESGKVLFKVTLVWTDPPGPVFDGGLVNDLDLEVIDPNGQQYNGNVQEPPFDQDTDSRNNVEGVLIKNPVPGPYEIIVRAKRLQTSPQDFALVWSGHLAEEGPIKPED